MRPLSRRDLTRVMGLMSDADAMVELAPTDVRPRDVDIVALIEAADPDGSLMSWSLDLPDGTPVGMANWREDLPWLGVYHVEVVMSSMAPDRVRLIAEGYRLIRDYVFEHLRARKVTAKSSGVLPELDEVFAGLGMAQEGTLRKHAVLMSTEHDIKIYGVARDEWRGRDGM
jgi:RimJ/RimL family protein N-acetyltransferase